MNRFKVRYSKFVNYWETDKMSIVHHSNYIKWFEEARLHFLRQCSLPYDKIEKSGIWLPVYEVYAKYVKPASFEDKIDIDVSIKELTPIKLTLEYVVLKDNDILATGYTVHPITDEKLKIKRNSTLYFELKKLID
ncbi:MAG: acyl-CoA thioesterase [Exilispira sp.]|jgi:acyl-CoA thioester hydrolase|nr:acyl-CoA thioesterase [Exilispira sp.]